MRIKDNSWKHRANASNNGDPKQFKQQSEIWRKTKEVAPHKPSNEDNSKSKKIWLAASSAEDRGCIEEQIILYMYGNW